MTPPLDAARRNQAPPPPAKRNRWWCHHCPAKGWAQNAEAARVAGTRHFLDADSGETHGLPSGDRGVVLHVRPEGWALYEVPIGDEVFEHFLHLLKGPFVWESLSRSVVGKPVLKGSGL